MKAIVKTLYMVLWLYIGHAYAQKNSVGHNFSKTILEGVVEDLSILNMPNKEADVTIIISKYPVSAVNMLGAEYDRYELKAKYNEFFKLQIKPPAKRFYLYIYYQPGPKTLNWSSFDNVYIMDSGDRVKVSLDKDNFSFSGRGSEKLNCESEIYKKKYDYSQEIIHPDSTDLKKYFENLNLKMDSCLLLQTAIVKKYRLKLGKEMSDILLANCYGLRYYEPLRGQRQLSEGNSSLYSAVINSKGYKNIDISLKGKILPEILAQSPIYVDFIFEKIRMNNFLENKGVLQLPTSIAKSFEYIKQNYNGIIRAKLLALFFINYSSIPTSLNYLEEAISLSEPSIYRDILSDMQKTKLKGLPFYPFALPDVEGRVVKLSDLNNKVVILDFWYTGCINCINLKNAMNEIHQAYRNNPNIAFVSVSIDKDKQKWIKSVSSGMYCDPKGINLFTDGLADNHPLIIKYAIQGYPRTFILKSGKMFNASPPFPNGKSITDGGTKQLVDLIEEALNSK